MSEQDGQGAGRGGEGVVAGRLRAALVAGLQPTHLDVVDESYKHAKHAHVVARAGTAGASSGETHFLVKVTSPLFADRSRLERHRMVNDLVAGEMGPDKVHALAIEARAPGE